MDPCHVILVFCSPCHLEPPGHPLETEPTLQDLESHPLPPPGLPEPEEELTPEPEPSFQASSLPPPGDPAR